MPRVLLVEFVNVDMHPGQCGILFPFVNGCLSRDGVPARWIRFGVRASNQLVSKKHGIDLSPADRSTLVSEARAFRPTHVLFSTTPAPPLRELVTTGVAAPAVDHMGPSIRGSRLAWVESLRQWLDDPNGPDPGPAGDGAPIVEVEPDFGWRAGNDLAVGKRPIADIVVGPECLHRAPIGANPCYREVDLEGVATTRGCAFCVDGSAFAGTRLFADPAATAVAQIHAAHRTLPNRGRRVEYVVHGADLFRRVDDFARRLAETDLPGCDLLFGCRASAVSANVELIERAIEHLRDSGHSFNIHLVGIENLSQAELDRMNKGCTTLDVARCIDTLVDLERRYPDTFFFRKHKGLSTILFTPWTTLSDLRFNLRFIELFAIGDAFGKLLSSRLRLSPGLAMTALAARDGLLLDAYEDPALDTAKRTMYQSEQPWRFLHPEVEGPCRVAVRIDREPALRGDGLYAEVQSVVRALPAGSGARLGAFAELLDIVREPSPSQDVGDLVARWRRRLEERGVAGDPPVGPTGVGRLLYQAPTKLLLARAGLKPVWKIENLSRGEVDELLESPVIREFPSRHARVPASGDSRPGRRVDLFVGLDQRTLRRALGCTEVIEASQDPEEVAEAIHEMGTLLGYPPCCARAYSQLPIPARDLDGWMMLRRRLQHPGAVPPIMNPFHRANSLFDGFIPCSLACSEAERLLGRTLEVTSRTSGPDGYDGGLEGASNPILFMLSEHAFAELVPCSEVGERFSYSVGAIERGSGRIEGVLAGDSLVLEPGRIMVFDGACPVHTFDLEAAIWWHRKAFHPELWQLCADQALREEPAVPAEASLPRVLPAWAREGLVRGWRVSEARRDASGTRSATLTNGPQRLTLFAQPRASGAKGFISSERFVLQYKSSTPVDSREKMAVALELLRLIEAEG